MAQVSGALQAAIFDMDGVITQTASLHASAWKLAFDDFLRRRANGQAFRPFDEHEEYRAYVDGKPRLDGVRSFLQARKITASEEEMATLAECKDSLFEQALHAQGVQTFASTLSLIEALRTRGVKIGMVTSSRHGQEIMRVAGITGLFDICVDGNDLDASALKGKPDPAMFLYAAQQLGVAPGRAMVVEDAVAGVQAGRRGEFGLVVGIDREGNPQNANNLRSAGADIVLPDLAGLGIPELEAAWRAQQEDNAWRIEQEGFDRARERQMESLFAVGNGYLGVRGALDSPLPGSQGDMFVAGIYDRKCAELPYSEIEFLAPERGDNYAELVHLPFPFALRATRQGATLDFAGSSGRELHRVLDLRRGVLHEQTVYQTADGQRTRIDSRRCASLADPHLLLQEVRVTPENDGPEVEFEALLDGQELERHLHIQLVEHTQAAGMDCRLYATRASAMQVCVVSRILREAKRMRRLISVFTSRDTADPKAAALAHSKALDPDNFEQMFNAHAAKWMDFWDRADIRASGRPAIEQVLRFGSYHLRSAASEDSRVSIGARALTGRAYEGHVFWDTEIYMLPFFLHVEPAIARALLLYRHHTLDGARRRAQRMGFRGACFAWESTVTGEDVTPTQIRLKSTGKEIPIFTGDQQVHISADIAYAVWRYWEATGDEAFLVGPGAELLFETARFWASRATQDGQHYHLRGVMGPDEYHHAVNDNAYTNWMARFNLERAAWLAQHMGIDDAESRQWREVADSLYVPVPNEQGIIEQFQGFFALDDYPLPKDERFKAPVSRLFGWEEINRIKLIKQADVLMLLWLFPQAFSDEVVAANYRYYEALTDHGSSLSPAIHAGIAARIGLQEEAQSYWERSLWLDLSNAMDNSVLGVHAAAMAGAWQALVFGFLGIGFDDKGPHPGAHADQRLPAGCDGIELKLMFRGQEHEVKVRRRAKDKEDKEIPK